MAWTFSSRRAKRTAAWATLSDFFGVYDALTVRQCLVHAAAIHGIAGERAGQKRRRARRARLGIADRLEVAAGTLSRGLRQRLAIGNRSSTARGCSARRAGRGSRSRGAPRPRRSLPRLRASGMTLVVSSHFLAELDEYSTDMLVLQQGRVGRAAQRARRGHERRRRLRVRSRGRRRAARRWPSRRSRHREVAAEARATFELRAARRPQAALLRALVAAGSRSRRSRRRARTCTIPTCAPVRRGRHEPRAAPQPLARAHHASLVAMPAVLVLVFALFIGHAARDWPVALYTTRHLDLRGLELWGARQASEAVTEEVRDRTGTGSASRRSGPWEMAVGQARGRHGVHVVRRRDLPRRAGARRGARRGRGSRRLALALVASGVALHGVLLAASLQAARKDSRLAYRLGSVMLLPALLAAGLPLSASRGAMRT
jgi:energy-coupling factor transporter ATP-binding protein EcfA2